MSTIHSNIVILILIVIIVVSISIIHELTTKKHNNKYFFTVVYRKAGLQDNRIQITEHGEIAVPKELLVTFAITQQVMAAYNVEKKDIDITSITKL